MDTRERLEKFHVLTKEGNESALKAFVEANREDKRFMSLIDLRNAFLAGFKRELEQEASIPMNYREVLLEQEFEGYGLELVRYVSTAAKKRARRLAAALL